MYRVTKEWHNEIAITLLGNLRKISEKQIKFELVNEKDQKRYIVPYVEVSTYDPSCLVQRWQFSVSPNERVKHN